MPEGLEHSGKLTAAHSHLNRMTLNFLDKSSMTPAFRRPAHHSSTPKVYFQGTILKQATSSTGRYTVFPRFENVVCSWTFPGQPAVRATEGVFGRPKKGKEKVATAYSDENYG